MHYYNYGLLAALQQQSAARFVYIASPATARHPLRPDGLCVRTTFAGIYGDAPKWYRGWRYGLSLVQLGWWCQRERPRLVHFHFFQIPALDLLLLRWLKWLNIPIVTTVHDVLPFAAGTDFAGSQGNIYHRLYHLSSGLVIHSQYARNALAQLDAALLSKALTIPHGGFANVSSHYQTEQEAAKAALDFAPGAPLILIFGTVKPNKRLDLAIQALQRVSHSYPKAQLVVVGKPQDRTVANARTLARELGVEDHIIWHLDYATDQQMGLFFSAADVALFPYQWIYQSGALLMAMSFGRPVIATAVGSNADTIEHEVNGLLVPLDDPDKMADAILTLLDDPAAASALGQRANEHVSDQLSWKRFAARLLAFYDKIGDS
jgi:glycosyltransferase involved in cell wall biosynthesis